MSGVGIPIPRDLTLDLATVLALSEADAAPGHLQGLEQLIIDPQLLIGPYVTHGDGAVVRLLLDAGADPDLVHCPPAAHAAIRARSCGASGILNLRS